MKPRKISARKLPMTSSVAGWTRFDSITDKTNKQVFKNQA